MEIDETNIHKILCRNNMLLYCRFLKITSLIIPNNICSKLKEIHFCFDQLTSLIIPETCTALEVIQCYGNQLTTLTIPDTCTKLETIYCHSNQLTTLTVPGACTKLRKIWCSNNQLTSLIIPDTRVGLKNVRCDEIKLILILCSHNFILTENHKENHKNRYAYHKEQTEKHLTTMTSIIHLQQIRLFC